MVTIDNDDMYSLLKWCEAEALKAHNQYRSCSDSCHNIECDGDDGICVSSSCDYHGMAVAYDKVADKIRNGRISQRPHFDGM